MKILVKRTIHYYIDKYPLAERPLLMWASEFSGRDFGSFNEIKSVYRNASIIGNNRVVFNIKGNDFRLVVSMNFIQRACYVIWFGTHKEYDKIDAVAVDYDKSINNYKKGGLPSEGL